MLPGSGGDWLTIRNDGVQLIDVRATVQTDDGALIYATYTGCGEADVARLRLRYDVYALK